jgi:acyl-CoA synthetase (AMP-forming)/AMP-acid ligase II
MDNTDGFHVSIVEKLAVVSGNFQLPPDADPPVYMLTSGSSGNAKAVELQSHQIFASMNGKVKGLGSKSDDVFLNWIGFDHVANLTECHLHAMYLGADQHHVPAADVISEPLVFLKLLHDYKTTATFAPNFYLARLCDYIQGNGQSIPDKLDPSNLRRINSGGEANLVETAVRLEKALQKLRAKTDLVVPGFSMSETCAGSIYSAKRLQYDVAHNREFTSLGQPVPGLEMRIAKEDGTCAAADELGVLQISGPIVFSRYLNNPKATSDAFTANGWFSTGDKAFLDDKGSLYLSGRDKDLINIDGQSIPRMSSKLRWRRACPATSSLPIP